VLYFVDGRDPLKNYQGVELCDERWWLSIINKVFLGSSSPKRSPIYKCTVTIFKDKHTHCNRIFKIFVKILFSSILLQITCKQNLNYFLVIHITCWLHSMYLPGILTFFS
jgi:hypothetical protein